MINDFTIFFTYVCENDLRREYIKIALKTLFQSNNEEIDIPIFVIDGSSKKEFSQNKEIFKDIKSLEYIHDEEVNPFKRCNKYIDQIKTKFILRLLEDCAFINFSKNKFKQIKEDMKFLDLHHEIDAVNYPIVDDSKYFFNDNKLYYSPINFDRQKVYKTNKRLYYMTRYNYLCNNILYKKKNMLNQWSYLSNNYLTHNDAEAGRINIKLFEFPLKIKYLRGVLIRLIKIFERIFKRKYICRNTAVLDTCFKCDAVHVGYYRSEINPEKYQNNGNPQELANLSMFNDMHALKNLIFKRI